MNSNNIVFSTIAIMVCVVLIGCCLVPIVQDSVVGRDVTHEVTYTNEITGSKSVYKLASGDTITVDLSGYTVNAGGVDYTTTSDIMLVDPDDGLIIPDYTNIAVKLYEADGITEIESDFDKIKQIFVSGSTTWIITESGKLFGCGAGANGQQGNNSTSDVNVFTAREIGSAPAPTIISYIGTDLTIKDIVIESQPTIYLISSIAALDTSGLIYIDRSDTPLEYYANPTSVLSFSAAADSFYIGQGTEILTGYDTTAALTINQGTATQASTIFTYSGATFPITATNVSGYSMLIDGSYTGTYTTHEGGTDNQMWAILATLTVTLTIIGVVLGAVRMIGGRE